MKKSSSKNNINDNIVLQWVSTHNLKNIDVTIPKNKLITITGVSGSGKSSLAFHTIYKEGQFRYIESLSSYLRQFFQLWSRPDIEYTSWLSPAIAIEQNKHIGNSRSSVGTLTEIDDYLRLLYSKVWAIYSYGSGKPIKTQNIDQIIDTINNQYINQKVFLLQEIYTCDEKKELEMFVKKNRNKVEKEKW
jgi:excinuclease ABC subunit A